MGYAHRDCRLVHDDGREEVIELKLTWADFKSLQKISTLDAAEQGEHAFWLAVRHNAGFETLKRADVGAVIDCLPPLTIMGKLKMMGELMQAVMGVEDGDLEDLPKKTEPRLLSTAELTPDVSTSCS